MTQAALAEAAGISLPVINDGAMSPPGAGAGVRLTQRAGTGV
jgi:hypothetical protein